MSFANASGLDVSSTTAGAYGSAKDVALLVSHIVSYDPRLLEATSLSKGTFNSKEISHVGSNTDRSIDNIPNVLASKTGYTDLSGGNLVVEWNAGVDHPIVISILGSSYDGRFTDMEALVKATLEYLSKKAQ
jgi:D-alanyl-D-alanine carboxypeptidase